MYGPDDLQSGLLPSGRQRQEAAQLMRDHNVGVIPVVDDHSARLQGLVTDRDLVLRVVAENRSADTTQVRQVMTSAVVTCRPYQSIDDAIAAMERHQIRRIPVVDDGGRLVGIISQGDIAARMREPATTAEVIAEISRPAAMRRRA